MVETNSRVMSRDLIEDLTDKSLIGLPADMWSDRTDLRSASDDHSTCIETRPDNVFTFMKWYNSVRSLPTNTAILFSYAI